MVFRIVPALVSLVIVLLLLEVYVRIFLKERVDTDLLMAGFKPTSVQSFIRQSPDPAIHFELKPSVSMDWYGSRVVTGPEGYRVSDEVEEAREGVVRIAVLGDSSSFGWLVNYRDSYPERYRRQMEAYTQAPTELRNYSVPGYNTKQELHTFLTKVMSYKPDLLIVHRDHNDPDPTGIYGLPYYLRPKYGDNIFHSALIKYILRRFRRFQHRNKSSNSKEGHEYVGVYIVGGRLYEDHLKDFQRLAEATRSLNIPTVVILFNAFVNADENYENDSGYIKLHKQLRNRLTDMGFHVLDMYPLYQAELQRRGWPDLSEWWISSNEPVDGHPNAQGHQYIADKLFEYTLAHPELKAIFQEK